MVVLLQLLQQKPSENEVILTLHYFFCIVSLYTVSGWVEV